MPSFEKSPPELVARFDAAAERHPLAQRRKMFGYPALFVGGKLATSLYRDTWVVRLGPDDLEALRALPGSGSFAPMPGRTMRGWATLPPDVISDEGRLDHWLARAMAFAGSLPTG
jgi:TfoX/Sxy family transcriptional regulator of competence genes